MGSGPIVLDISSDDDEGFSLDDQFDEPYDWMNQLLSDKETEEPDDIMVADRSFTSEGTQKGNLASLKSKNGALEDKSDDDCLILDGDPDKPVSGNDEKGEVGDGSDDLLIVGEKGQVACRDFPHSRHLCANFPFYTTAHEKHCNLCHCYVCDSHAPCLYWGNGGSLSDHCHATDKVEMWKAQRKSFQKINAVTLPPKRHPEITPSVILPPIQNLEPNHRSNSVSLKRSNPLCPCSGTNTATPFAPTQQHLRRLTNTSNKDTRFGHHRNRFQPMIPAAQSVQRERRGSGTFSRPFMQSHPQFKKVGISGSSLVTSRTNRSHHIVSSPDQIERTALQKHQHPPVVSLISPHQPVPLQRTHSPGEASSENTARDWWDMLVSMASDLGVADSISESTTGDQPGTISSQVLPSVGSQIISSSQDTVAYPPPSPVTLPSEPLDFSFSWLGSRRTETYPEQCQGGNQPTAAVQISSPVVSESNPVPGEIQLAGNNLATVEQELAPVAGKELDLPEISDSFLFDFESTWSGLAQG